MCGMHSCMYGGMDVCIGIWGVLEQAGKGDLPPGVSLDQSLFLLFWILATVSVGVFKASSV